MKHFKNLKNGFSFIEIMVALMLLSIFGTSIFLVQGNIFSRVSKSHKNLLFSQNIVYDLLQLKNKVHQAILNDNSIENIEIKENKTNPDHTISVKLISISNESELHLFSKNLKLVKSSALYDNRETIDWFSFMYIPEKIEKKNSDPKEKKQ